MAMLMLQTTLVIHAFTHLKFFILMKFMTLLDMWGLANVLMYLGS